MAGRRPFHPSTVSEGDWPRRTGSFAWLTGVPAALFVTALPPAAQLGERWIHNSESSGALPRFQSKTFRKMQEQKRTRRKMQAGSPGNPVIKDVFPEVSCSAWLCVVSWWRLNVHLWIPLGIKLWDAETETCSSCRRYFCAHLFICSANIHWPATTCLVYPRHFHVWLNVHPHQGF